jgi:predicted RND superfamily exporter protein
MVATGFMGYLALNTRISYDFALVVPENNPIHQDFRQFKETFGDDGNVMVIGAKTPSLFQLNFFRHWYTLGNDIKAIDGISGILSVPHALTIQRDDEKKAFHVSPLVQTMPETQDEVDSLRHIFLGLPFYEGLIHNRVTGTTLMAITFNREQLDSKVRLDIVDSILAKGESFAKAHEIELHYSGLPHIRTYTVTTIADELRVFMALAVAILAVLLFILFRNINAVIFPTLVVAMSAMWSLGLLNLFGFKVTMLTGLLPTLIVVIGIPNCVYLLNKYHLEFKKHGNKQKSLMRTVEKTGAAIWFTNLTTAIGFGVFFFTHVEILKEFGLVAFVSIVSLFLIAVAMIPVVFSYLPAPKYRHIVHLDNRVMEWVLNRFEAWSSKRRVVIFGVALAVIVVGVFGILRLESKGFILDDVPKKAKVYTDLKFFEKNFNGVLPFEVMVNSGKNGGVNEPGFLRKLDRAQDSLARMPVFSKSLSVADAIKFARQAYRGGNPKDYRLPNNFEMAREYPFLQSYSKHSDLNDGVSRGFVDDSGRVARISMQVADIGSDSMPHLVARVQPMLDSIFTSGDDGVTVTITGTSLMKTEGFRYLITGLVNSVLLAFLLISVIMGYLFRSLRILIISLIPNVIPLMVTAGLMGFLNIPIKPSTVLIFSVAFGISVDYTIHFLAKYKQERYRHNWELSKTVTAALRETGMSMIYTSLILFFGFIVFTASGFESTANLGKLTSITLIVAMLCNLLLLPALLMTFERLKSTGGVRYEPLLDAFAEDLNEGTTEVLEEQPKTHEI